MARIEIGSVSQLQALQAKFRALKSLIPILQQSSIKEASEEILDEIKTKMSQNDFSDKIIDATFVGRIDRAGQLFRTHFISDYVSDTGFDVSNAREEGTTQTRPITPKNPDGALKITGPYNQVFFRKSSRPSGIERLLIIENTIKENQSITSERVSEIYSQKVQKVLGV